ncbi:MAG: glycogen/starch synthase [Bacteroidota bacterium]
MKKSRVLFVSHEIFPYVDGNEEMGKLCRHLPQGIQEKGKEIRTFMPRFGCVNERRNQLHEVIRLSGMNLIIDDSDHPLIIKVASIQSARMQVYFIDNEEYFQRKATFRDAKDKFFKDNDDRTIFFCRGVLETVKKLGWSPDVIHCHGWMTSLIPLYVKTSYKDDPMFRNSKVIYSVYDEGFEEKFNETYTKKLMMEGISASDIKDLKNPGYENLTVSAISKSDAVIMGSQTINPTVKSYLKKANKPVLDYQSPDDYVDAYNNFYEEILMEDTVLV